LALIWWASLQRLQLPSTRMLLSQHAQLVALTETNGRALRALVEVSPSWLPMVDSRRALVVAALAETLTRPVQLDLLEVGR
jgi:DNA polymerase-3 subunit gamma/tau